MGGFDKKQTQHFIEHNRQTDALARRIDGLNELVQLSMNALLAEIMRTGKVGEESLRNVIVLRSIHYIFLLGYKTGRFEPNETTNWEGVVKFAHKKARQLSHEELEKLTDANLDDEIITKMSVEMFKEIKRLQK